MINGLPRFYKSYNSGRGPSYFIFDRNTGEKIDEAHVLEVAENKVRDLNEKDRKERGLPELDEVQTPAGYYGCRNRTEHEISAMPIHK